MTISDQISLIIGGTVQWGSFFGLAVYIGYKLGRSVQRANGWRGWRIRFRHWRQNMFGTEETKWF